MAGVSDIKLVFFIRDANGMAAKMFVQGSLTEGEGSVQLTPMCYLV
jgi:hypothetical protein